MLEKCSSYIPQEAKHSHLLLSLWELLFFWRGGEIKNSLLVYYCIQNQNKLGEMNLNILKLLLEKGFFRFCLQAELQMSQDQHVF